jgi:F0F1-type ATP synthase assembly protein I
MTIISNARIQIMITLVVLMVATSACIVIHIWLISSVSTILGIKYDFLPFLSYLFICNFWDASLYLSNEGVFVPSLS